MPLMPAAVGTCENSNNEPVGASVIAVIPPAEMLQRNSNKKKLANKLITSAQQGQRIDNFLIAELKNVPKSHIYRILRKGEVRVNSKRIKPEYRLVAGDTVRLPPLFLLTPPTIEPDSWLVEHLSQAILYENDDIVIINKPAGVAVHSGTGINYGVIDAIRKSRPDLSSLELVHRLDKDTSGCLILAKHRNSLQELQCLLRDGKICKHYLALVRGEWRAAEQWVDMPLKRFLSSSGERRVCIHEQGKSAKTFIQSLQIFSQATLVNVRPITGRTHQIRVHSDYLGYPIAGDDKYGDERFNQTMKYQGLKRMFLHAHHLEFTIPSTGVIINTTAKLPDDLQRVLENLNKTSSLN